MSNKVIIKPTLCNCCNITLPYIINIESPSKRIGIFGDSFAGLQDELTYSKIHLNDDLWSHEFSWMYYLGMLTNAEIHSWGLSRSSEAEIIFLLTTCSIKYDLYIIVHTSPARINTRIDLPKKFSLYSALKKLTENKKIIHLYWDKGHQIYEFKNGIEYCFEDILSNHINDNDLAIADWNPNFKKSKFDKSNGMNHLSNRGNLLLSMKINKLLA